jgi:hypothetical protein
MTGAHGTLDMYENCRVCADACRRVEEAGRRVVAAIA